ncbi:MAG: right-handed parallel beta-helix repeat-containing protein [Candidatus Omnitrophica bacterium]|nr:right-handed parallel beta-helix repeat-containing protein [Candidatus Omnitrophota bacterium]
MNVKLITQNSIHRIFFFCLLAISYGLLAVNCGPAFASDDHLTVKENIKADSITFTGDVADYPAAPLEGELFYNSTGKLMKYFDGTAWQGFGAGSGPKTAASRIVAASNSLDTSRADYICDGTDDQVEIQAAIDDLGTVGGAVYLMEGTFNISASINLDNVAPDDSNKSIIGTGKGSVLKLAAAIGSTGVIKTYYVNKILITNLMIDGNSKLGSEVTGLLLNKTDYSKIAGVWIENMSGTGITIGYNQGAKYNIIINNHIQFNKRGIYNTFGGGVTGSSVDNNIISQNVISNNSYSGIQTYTYGGAGFKNNVISNNSICSNGASGINLDGYCGNDYNNIIIDNNVNFNSSFGINLASYCRYSVVVGNNVSNNTNGIGVLCGTQCGVISKNVVSNSGRGILMSGSFNLITQNIIYENIEDGIYSGVWSLWGHNNIISSNRIFDSAGTGYGINIGSNTCGNNYLIGNLIDGAGNIGAGYDRRINDSGTNTKYTQKEKITIERQTAVIPAAGSTLDVSTNPKGYVPLSPASAVTLNAVTAIANGKAAGDILILEGTDNTNTVTVPDGANVSLGASRCLGENDMLKLIWNGTRWLEMKWTDN